MSSSVPAVVASPPALPPAAPLLRGWLHLLWFEVSLVVGTVFVSEADPGDRTVVAIYAGTVSALFGTSALYHRGAWGPRSRTLLQRLDHAMIFLLTAGSATPIFTASLDGAARAVALAVMWTLAGLALLIHLVWMQAPEALVGSTYVGLGCIGAVALPAVWIGSGVPASALVASGGVLYIVGAVMYHLRRPDPVPTVFGYHEVFHSFVCAGATLHYVAIACLIV